MSADFLNYSKLSAKRISSSGRRISVFCMTMGKCRPDQKSAINSPPPRSRESGRVYPPWKLRTGCAVPKYYRAPGCGLCVGEYDIFEWFFSSKMMIFHQKMMIFWRFGAPAARRGFIYILNRSETYRTAHEKNMRTRSAATK